MSKTGTLLAIIFVTVLFGMGVVLDFTNGRPRFDLEWEHAFPAGFLLLLILLYRQQSRTEREQAAEAIHDESTPHPQ